MSHFFTLNMDTWLVGAALHGWHPGARFTSITRKEGLVAPAQNSR